MPPLVECTEPDGPPPFTPSSLHGHSFFFDIARRRFSLDLAWNRLPFSLSSLSSLLLALPFSLSLPLPCLPPPSLHNATYRSHYNHTALLERVHTTASTWALTSPPAGYPLT